MKKAALEPFQQQNLLVKQVYGRDDKEQIARAFAAERGITEGGCVRSERDGDGAYIPALQDGHGDPPLAGPVFSTSDATGTFVAVFEKAPQAASGRVVLNTVTFWTPILFGEKWAKYDFRDGSAQACR